MNIEQIALSHGIPGMLRVLQGPGGLPLLEVDTPLARASVTLLGAQVLSYRPKHRSADLLFVSERAYFALGQEIKGGVPICWPWFGRDPESRGRLIHGFARTLIWELLGTERREDGSIGISFRLTDDPGTRAIWPHPFELRLEVSIGETLAVSLTTHNPTASAYQITQGLHAYFKISDPTQVAVHGLEGCRYIDKAAGGGDRIVPQEGAVQFAAEVNRIYEAVTSPLVIEDRALARRIRIDALHSRTAVVWNPWIESARAMPDLDDLDYQRFICVETVNTASEVIEVPAGGEVSIGATYQIQLL